MRSRQRDLYVYGLFWGALAFLSGVALTLLTLPEKFDVGAIPSWKVASWIWVNAHGIPIAESSVSGDQLAFGSVELIQPNPELHLLRAIPILLSAGAVLLLTDAMNGFRDDGELVEFGVVGAGGYMFAGVGTILLTDARPGIGLMVGLLAVLGGAAYIGSRVANSLPIPIFAVTSIGGLVGIGLLVIIGAGAVLTVAVPLAKVAIAGSFAAVVPLWVSKNLDF